MAQSLTNFDSALKDTYEAGLRNALNNSHPILTEVVKDRENFSGRTAKWAVHTGRSAATGYRPESGTLPTTNHQRVIQPSDDLAYLYHTIEVTGQAKHLTKNERGAFANALSLEMKAGEKDLKNVIARSLNNVPKTIDSVSIQGALATINGTPNTNVITLDDDGAALPANRMRWFYVGQLIDSVTPATGAISEAAMVITAITPATPSITVDDDGSAADNDYLFASGSISNGGSPTVGYEINGLPFVIGTGDYAGITVSSNPAWAGLTIGSSSEGISETLLERAKTKVETDGDGSTPNLFLAEHSNVDKLASLLTAQKRFEGRIRELPAGWEGISLGGATIVKDRYVDTTKVYGVTTSDLGWFIGLDWQWDDDDGRILRKSVARIDSIEAQFKGYFNLEAYNRNSHVTVTVAAPSFS